MKSSDQPPSIVIIDYGMGNVRSVQCALSRLGCDAEITSDADKIAAAAGLVLPGVGAFGKAMENLKERNLVAVLNQAVAQQHKPILGICLGMQLFAGRSTEMGTHAGLGWITGSVNLIDTGAQHLAVPHVGWNNIVATANSTTMFNRIEDGAHFYFDHSFHLETDERYVSSTTSYGVPLTASVIKDNIWGAQFHPEKSQNAGLKLLRNYLNFVAASMLEEQVAC